MFYTIPKRMQEQVIDFFCNTKLKLIDIISLVDPNHKIPLMEYYKLLENYKNENGGKLERPRNSVDPKYKVIVHNMRLENKRYKAIETIRERENRFNSQIKKNVTFIRVYDSKISELDERGLTLIQIREYFLDYGIDIYEECNVEAESEIRYFKKVNSNLELQVRRLTGKGVSLGEISKCLKDTGIMLSHESIRKICKIEPSEIEHENKDDIAKNNKTTNKINTKLKEEEEEER